MNWNAYSPTPQLTNIILYTFWIVPPILNLGIQGTLHTFKQTKPYHSTYNTLGHIVLSMLADHWDKIPQMRELWKLGS